MGDRIRGQRCRRCRPRSYGGTEQQDKDAADADPAPMEEQNNEDKDAADADPAPMEEQNNEDDAENTEIDLYNGIINNVNRLVHLEESKTSDRAIPPSVSQMRRWIPVSETICSSRQVGSQLFQICQLLKR